GLPARIREARPAALAGAEARARRLGGRLEKPDVPTIWQARGAGGPAEYAVGGDRVDETAVGGAFALRHRLPALVRARETRQHHGSAPIVGSMRTFRPAMRRVVAPCTYFRMDERRIHPADCPAIRGTSG